MGLLKDLLSKKCERCQEKATRFRGIYCDTRDYCEVCYFFHDYKFILGLNDLPIPNKVITNLQKMFEYTDTLTGQEFITNRDICLKKRNEVRNKYQTKKDNEAIKLLKK